MHCLFAVTSSPFQHFLQADSVLTFSVGYRSATVGDTEGSFSVRLLFLMGARAETCLEFWRASRHFF